MSGSFDFHFDLIWDELCLEIILIMVIFYFIYFFKSLFKIITYFKRSLRRNVSGAVVYGTEKCPRDIGGSRRYTLVGEPGQMFSKSILLVPCYYISYNLFLGIDL